MTRSSIITLLNCRFSSVNLLDLYGTHLPNGIFIVPLWLGLSLSLVLFWRKNADVNKIEENRRWFWMEKEVEIIEFYSQNNSLCEFNSSYDYKYKPNDCTIWNRNWIVFYDSHCLIFHNSWVKWILRHVHRIKSVNIEMNERVKTY